MTGIRVRSLGGNEVIGRGPHKRQQDLSEKRYVGVCFLGSLADVVRRYVSANQRVGTSSTGPASSFMFYSQLSELPAVNLCL